MIEEFSWLLLGVAAGTFTGLAPGIHANTIAFIAMVSPVEKNLGFAIFVVSMSITHSFMDAIPNILLGAPSSGEMFLSILPGHRMLLQGRALEAIRFTVFGGLASGIFGVALLPIFYSFAENYGNILPVIIPAVLAGTLLLMVLSEKNKLMALAVTALAGIIGVFVLGSGIKNGIFVLVMGFYAFPSLLVQALSKEKGIPAQEKKPGEKGSVFHGLVSAVASGIVSVFPGIGPSAAAFVVKTFTKKMKETEYLTIIGGINTGNLLFSIAMLYSLGKTRTGMAVALKDISPISFESTAVFLAAAVASIGIAALLTEMIAWESVKFMEKIDYGKVSLIVMGFLALLLTLFSGIEGLAAAAIASLLAGAALASKVKRSTLMAFLIFPAMFYYIGITV